MRANNVSAEPLPTLTASHDWPAVVTAANDSEGLSDAKASDHRQDN